MYLCILLMQFFSLFKDNGYRASAYTYCLYQKFQVPFSVLFSVLKKWVHYYNRSVCPSGRPAVYTITFERRVRSWWNFLYSLVLSISRSSSKMSLIGRSLPELLQKHRFFLMIFLWEDRYVAVLVRNFSIRVE